MHKNIGFNNNFNQSQRINYRQVQPHISQNLAIPQNQSNIA